MFDSIVDSVSDALGSVRSIIDEVNTTDAERLKLKRKINRIEAKVRKAVLSVEKKRIEAKQGIITAAKEQPFWKSWRGLVMLGVFVLALLHSVVPDMGFFNAEQLTALLKWGLGGYMGLEGANAISKNLAPAAAAREQRKAEQARERAERHRRAVGKMPAPELDLEADTIGPETDLNTK